MKGTWLPTLPREEAQLCLTVIFSLHAKIKQETENEIQDSSQIPLSLYRINALSQ